MAQNFRNNWYSESLICLTKSLGQRLIWCCNHICPSAVQQDLLNLKKCTVVPVLGLEEITSHKNRPTSFLHFKSTLNYLEPPWFQFYRQIPFPKWNMVGSLFLLILQIALETTWVVLRRLPSFALFFPKFRSYSTSTPTPNTYLRPSVILS